MPKKLLTPIGSGWAALITRMPLEHLARINRRIGYHMLACYIQEAVTVALLYRSGAAAPVASPILSGELHMGSEVKPGHQDVLSPASGPLAAVPSPHTQILGIRRVALESVLQGSERHAYLVWYHSDNQYMYFHGHLLLQNRHQTHKYTLWHYYVWHMDPSCKAV